MSKSQFCEMLTLSYPVEFTILLCLQMTCGSSGVYCVGKPKSEGSLPKKKSAELGSLAQIEGEGS